MNCAAVSKTIPGLNGDLPYKFPETEMGTAATLSCGEDSSEYALSAVCTASGSW